MNDKIRHAGIVDDVTDDCIKVRIMQTSACSACKVASYCSASEQKEKIIDVYQTSGHGNVKVGDNVVVVSSMQTGMKAVTLGFAIPFMILVITLIAVLNLTHNEGFAALFSIFMLVPYYLFIWSIRTKLKKKFSFVLE